MLCAFCKKESAEFGWDESSHLGKRPICYACIGDRDLRRLQEDKTIVLYKIEQRLVNQTKTLSFKIIEQKSVSNMVYVYFLVNKRRWEGVSYPEQSSRVICRKYKR